MSATISSLDFAGVRPRQTYVSDYRVDRLLSSGRLDRVFVAKQRTPPRLVALKVPHTPGKEGDAVRLEREARLAGSVTHSNVVRVFGFGIDRNQRLPFIAADFVRGLDLRQVLRSDGPLSIQRACEIHTQVALGLSAIHLAGVVHMDLKPDNILISRNKDGREQPVIVDFGIAQGNAEDAVARPFSGTPGFMSPEQLRGGRFDARTDLYALGCTLFESLTGAPPFRATSVPQLMLQHLHEAPPVPRVAVPLRLSELIRVLLAKDPTARPISALVVARALAGVAKEMRQTKARWFVHHRDREAHP